MKNLKTISIFALSALLAFSACKKDDVDQDDDQDGKKGDQSFKVRMTDNPGNYDELDVEITSISVLNSSNEWVELNANTQTVSVLELTNGKEEEIAFKNDVEADVYSKMKMEFSPNSKLTLNTFLSGGPILTKVDLSLMTSGQTQSVEFEIDQNISSSTNANVLVDFNVAQSVVDSAGTYFLDPQMTVIKDEKTGVKGKTKNEIRAALEIENESNSELTYSAYTNNDGEFIIRGMSDGTYTLTVMPDMDDGATLNSSYTFTGIVVVDGEITNMGEIEL